MKGTIHSLCPMDPIEAGETYRMEKYKDLEFRARVVKGAKDDPEIQRALKQIRKLTVELSDIAKKEKEEEEKNATMREAKVVRVKEKREWWKDGEYDAERADKANDLGSRCLKMAKENKNKRNNSAQRIEYEHAFEAYTEAIRLEPKKAVYFANRAFCALKLERYAIAAEDCDIALKLDPKYEKALLRGAKAHLKLNNETKAIEMYEFILKHIDRTHKEATKEREEAKAKLKSKTERANKMNEATCKGELRKPLFEEAEFLKESSEKNAENLIASEEMLRQIIAQSSTSPFENNARLEYVENCIKCQRVLFALDECENKLPRDSVDRLYLLAECKWRLNDVIGALRCLEPSSTEHECDEEHLKHSQKCKTLATRLRELETISESIESLVDREDYQLCVEKCDYVLEKVSMGRQPTRFRANILVIRASSLVEILKYSRGGASSGTSSSDDDALSSDSDSTSSSFLNEHGFKYTTTNTADEEKEKLDLSRLAKTALKSAKEALLLHANNVEAHVISHEIYLLANKRMKAFECIRLAQMLSPEDAFIARKVQKLAKLVSAMNTKAGRKKNGRYGSDVDLNNDDDDNDDDTGGESSKTPKLYKLLDCRQTARPKQIAKAYKAQAMKWHPDKQYSKDETAKLQAETRFKQIAFAFSILSDKRKRMEYDEDNTKFDQMCA